MIHNGKKLTPRQREYLLDFAGIERMGADAYYSKARNKVERSLRNMGLTAWNKDFKTILTDQGKALIAATMPKHLIK